jgi:protein O-GlcNAc transferase
MKNKRNTPRPSAMGSVTPPNQNSPYHYALACWKNGRLVEAFNHLKNWEPTDQNLKEAALQLIQYEINQNNLTAPPSIGGLPAVKASKRHSVSAAKILADLGRFVEARELTNKTLNDGIRSLDSYVILGRCEEKLNRPESALHAYRQGLDQHPGSLSLLTNMGLLLLNQNSRVEAGRYLQAALEVSERSYPSLINLAHWAEKSQMLTEAIALLEEAIELYPRQAVAYLNLAEIFITRRRYAMALLHLKRCLQLAPTWTLARANIAHVLYLTGDTPEAKKIYNELICLGYQADSVRKNLAKIYRDEGRIEDALKLLPSLESSKLPFVLGEIIYTRQLACDWKTFENDLNKLIDGVRDNFPVTTPFITLLLLDRPEIQHQSSRIYSKYKGPNIEQSFCFDEKKFPSSENQRLRIAYISSDFHSHATSQLLTEVLEAHDRESVEVILVSLIRETALDPYTARLMNLCVEWIDLSSSTLEEALDLLQCKSFDVAVDLKGYTKDSWCELFQHRIAAVQISFLGYPGTLGSDNIDFIISDNVISPKGEESLFSENILRLPCCYQPNAELSAEDGQALVKRLNTRRDALEYFRFGCLNNHNKLLPHIAKTWAEILKEVEKSELWLLVDNSVAQDNLKEFFCRFGVDARRLKFIARTSRDRFLLTMRQIDLILDTYPCGAHTTASDAMRVGTPIVTMMGKTFASRVASSLLIHSGIPDLVCDSFPSYKNLAIRLGTDSSFYQTINAKYITRVLDSPIFRPKQYARALEHAYYESIRFKTSSEY